MSALAFALEDARRMVVAAALAKELPADASAAVSACVAAVDVAIKAMRAGRGEGIAKVEAARDALKVAMQKIAAWEDSR